MTKKKPSPATRERLERVCLSIVEQADLGKAVPLVKRFSKNTLVEINRFDVFFRLYVSDEVRCSVRMSTGDFKARRDNFALYSPTASASEAEMRRILAEEVRLGRTLEAVSAAAHAEGHSPDWVCEHLGPWLEKWCDPEKEPYEGDVTRMTIRIDQGTLDHLREIAFVEGTSPNMLASRIVSEHIERWEPTEDERSAIERIRKLSASRG